MQAPERLELDASRLRRRVDPAALPFGSTEDVQPLGDTVGQPRALEAIEFGLEIESLGFNLFVAGSPGSGRESTTMSYLTRLARTRPVPDDWVYVHNFSQPDRPHAIHLPAGQGRQLARDMDSFLDRAQQAIPRAYDSEDYEQRRREVLAEVGHRRQALMEELQRFAGERGFAVESTPTGLVTLPVVDRHPLTPEDLSRMPGEERARWGQRGQQVEQRVTKGLRELRRLEKARSERVDALDREIASSVVGPLLEDLREKHADQPEVLAYLEQVQEDVPDQLPAFRPDPAASQESQAAGEGPPAMTAMAQSAMAQAASARREEHLGRYRINVLVDHSDTQGAPLVVERNPTYYNLVGRIDYRAMLGAMVTDFHQVKPGALHRANGGFLVLHVLDVLRQPLCWEALKRALRSRQVLIENLAEQFSFLPTATPQPEPVPLDLKVVLIGTPLLYRLLYAVDEDFRELFKVKADFAPEMDWNDEHLASYAAFLSRCVRDSRLRHLDRSAVARVVEHGSRLRDDQRKLSTRLLEISDVATEASFWAGKAGHELVQAEDVDQAIAKKEHRSNLLQERLKELIAQGTVIIDAAGARPGQVNGLSFVDLGDYQFGIPVRVTARAALGDGGVASIEREIELSGPVHSKGVLILSGYLAEQYAQQWPLALRATITFEQSYEEVEGDSASSAELYALLSALSGLPLQQGVAVTGSVSQHGELQAVGGVTRKVEGFFAVSKAKGLTGEQGVLIPVANIPNLMLSDELVEAVRQRRFHVWAARTVDEGIELLTGRPAGQRQEDGTFPEGTVHRLVADRLRRYADRLHAFSTADDGEGRLVPRRTERLQS